MKHSFDSEIAGKVGIVPALIYEYIRFWVEKNRKKENNEVGGEYWMYSSVEGFKDRFPYLTTKKIRDSLQVLIDNKLIKVGCFNKKPFDRTRWFTICPTGQMEKRKSEALPFAPQGKSICPTGQIHLPSRANPFAPQGKPIPYKEQLKNTVKEYNPYNPLLGVIENNDFVKSHPDIKNSFLEFAEHRKKIKSPMTDRAMELCIKTAIRLSDGDEEKIRAIIEQSIERGWKGLFELKTETKKTVSSGNPFEELAKEENLF